MTLSREEIQARIHDATFRLLLDIDAEEPFTEVAGRFSSAVVDALLPTPAPVAPPAGKYVPKVGDVVHRLPRTSTDGTVGVVYSTDDASQGRPIKIVGVGKDFGWSVACAADEVTYLRDSTPAERAAAGLPTSPPSPAPEVLTPDVPEGSTIAQLAAEQRASMGATQHFKHDITPAPEAKRPTHVRVTKDIEFDDLGKGDWFARGYEVLPAKWWDSDGNPVVATPRGHFGSLKPGEWEPAPCPPPVAGSARRVLTEEQFAFYEACRVLFLTNDDSPDHERIRDEFYDPVWVTVDAMKAAERGEVRP